MPARDGIAHRFDARSSPTAAERRRRATAARTIEYGESLGFDPNEFVYELTDGIIGDRYPGPDRICTHVEQILREYLADELLEGTPPAGRLGPVRDRGRHRGDLLRLRLARDQPPAPAGRPGRARWSPRSRPTSRSRASTATASTWSRSTRRRRRERRTHLAVPRRRDRQARRPVGQSAVRREPVEPAVGDARARDARPHHRHRRHHEPGADHRHRRRVRHVRPRLPLADGRAAGEHDRDLLVLEVLRRDRMAARRRRALPRQRHRPAHRGACRQRTSPSSTAATSRSRPRPPTSGSSTGWSPTAARSRSTTPPASRSRSRCR